MGLSIRTGMKPNKRFFFKRSESFQDLLHRLASSINIYLAEKHLEAVSYITMGKETMLVGLHPAEEEVGFYVDQGYLVCAAKTSSAGPGYHAFVIEMLDELENGVTSSGTGIMKSRVSLTNLIFTLTAIFKNFKTPWPVISKVSQNISSH